MTQTTKELAPDELWTYEQAASYLGIGIKSIYLYITRGILQGPVGTDVQDGYRHKLLSAQDIVQYAARRNSRMRKSFVCPHCGRRP